ncbi:MAG TPA: hypothetical protein VJP86_17705 [Vicinamibacterales bacterium]|jgi:mono/diheme cytochrome c family protein|nr:hypothetical protein [Vicinamibacterales bacterium]
MRQIAHLLVAAAAIGSTTFVAAQSSSNAARPVTFSEDVAPIVFNHCTSCHRPGEAAPFALLSYGDARPRGRAIAAAVESRQMPPWKAGAGDYPYHGDRRLTEAQIATIQQWVSQGMPEGDPNTLPKMPSFTDGWQLGEPDLVVEMPAAFDVPAKGRDVYRNFVLPLNLTEDRWVRAIDFRPSARTVVHHSLFSFDTTGAARQQDAEDDRPGYDGAMGGGLAGGAGRLLAILSGGRGRGGAGATVDAAARTTGSLGGWAPGSQPHPLPDDLAFFLPKGSDLILSTHFHPSGQAAREASRVGIYFAERPPSMAFSGIQLPPLFGALWGIDIPAGDANYTITDSFVIPVDVKAFGVGGHAHYLAKDMRLTATFPDGSVKTLLSIPDWDFAWQEGYRFNDYVSLPAGTRLDVSIRYDNSPANRRNPSSPPKRVTWGEQSTDEMGSMSVQVVAARAGDLPKLQQAYAAHVSDSLSNGALMRIMANRRGRGR